MRVISVLAFKGGVGKSSLAVNVGHALATFGQRVLLVDCDLQGNVSGLASEPAGATLTQVLCAQARLVDAIAPSTMAGLDVVPSDHDLDRAARHLTVEGRRGSYRLRTELETVRERYDVVLLDHSPSYSSVTECGLLASGELLVPAQLAPFAMEGLVTMFDKLGETLVDHPLTLAGIVPMMVDGRMAMHKAYRAELVETFGDRVLGSVRVDSAVGRAQSYGMTVLAYEPEARASHDFRAVAAALLQQAGEGGHEQQTV